MYYTACLLLSIQWQLLCQAIVSLVYEWEGLLKIVWGGGGGVEPQHPPLDPPLSMPKNRLYWPQFELRTLVATSLAVTSEQH